MVNLNYLFTFFSYAPIFLLPRWGFVTLNARSCDRSVEEYHWVFLPQRMKKTSMAGTTIPVPSVRLTWQWNICMFNRKYIFKRSILNCYVSLSECIPYTHLVPSHKALPSIGWLKLIEAPRRVVGQHQQYEVPETRILLNRCTPSSQYPHHTPSKNLGWSRGLHRKPIAPLITPLQFGNCLMMLALVV